MAALVSLASLAMLALSLPAIAQDREIEQHVAELIAQIGEREAHRDAVVELKGVGGAAVEPLLREIDDRAAAEDWGAVILLSDVFLDLDLKGARSPAILSGRLVLTLDKHGYDFTRRYTITTDGQVFALDEHGTTRVGDYMLVKGGGVSMRRFLIDSAQNAVYQLAVLVRYTENPDAAREAAMALGAFGPSAASAVRMLVRASEASEGFNAREAITALGMLGPSAEKAIPSLEKLSGHDNPQIAERAKAALRQIRRG